MEKFTEHLKKNLLDGGKKYTPGDISIESVEKYDGEILKFRIIIDDLNWFTVTIYVSESEVTFIYFTNGNDHILSNEKWENYKGSKYKNLYIDINFQIYIAKKYIEEFINKICESMNVAFNINCKYNFDNTCEKCGDHSKNIKYCQLCIDALICENCQTDGVFICHDCQQQCEKSVGCLYSEIYDCYIGKKKRLVLKKEPDDEYIAIFDELKITYVILEDEKNIEVSISNGKQKYDKAAKNLSSLYAMKIEKYLLELLEKQKFEIPELCIDMHIKNNYEEQKKLRIKFRDLNEMIFKIEYYEGTCYKFNIYSSIFDNCSYFGRCENPKYVKNIEKYIANKNQLEIVNFIIENSLSKDIKHLFGGFYIEY